jgi:hypothetical protein
MVLPISKTFGFNFSSFFQIQEFLCLIEKLNPISCIGYTLPNARDCIDTKFYNKLNRVLGLYMIRIQQLIKIYI